MRPTDVVALVAYVHELQPAQRVSEYTPDAWHDVLADVPATLQQARDAAARVARRQTWISPGEIRGELRRVIRPRPQSKVLALPSRFESDEERAERIRRGAGRCREVLKAREKSRTLPDQTTEGDQQ